MRVKMIIRPTQRRQRRNDGDCLLTFTENVFFHKPQCAIADRYEQKSLNWAPAQVRDEP